MKFHITGNAGSGKSTLAKTLALITHTQEYSLDTIVWQQGWKRAPAEQRAAKERALTKKPDWIIEGVSSIVRKEADFIIFLDYSRFTCYRRAFKRNIKYLFKSRPELPENCPEILIVPILIRIIWSFKNKVKPGIIKDIESKKGVVINNDRDLAYFLSTARTQY